MVTETNEDGWITYMDGDDLLERARRERALRGPGMIGLPQPVSSEFVGAIRCIARINQATGNHYHGN